MAFIPQNALERSLVAAANDPASRPQFYRDLLGSDILIVSYGPPPERAEHKVLQEGTSLRIQPVEIEGKPYLPLFSSLPRLQAVLERETGYLALNARVFLQITQGADLILNPGAEYGKVFTAQEVASLLDGSIGRPEEQYVAEQETRVMIGQPANEPRELVEALKRLFKGRKEVRRAWVAHFVNPARGEQPHTLLALEVTGSWDEIAGEVGLVVQGVTLPDPPLDLLRITGQGGVEDYFLREARPFYERKRFGLF